MLSTFKPSFDRLEDRTLPSFYVGELVIVHDTVHHWDFVGQVEVVQPTACVINPWWQHPGSLKPWVIEPDAFLTPIRPPG